MAGVRTAKLGGWRLGAGLLLASCSSSALPPGARCVIEDTVVQQAVVGVDRVDLLFVISDAPSMAEEQALLAQELPEIVQSLTTGKVGGAQQFAPVQDLQVGVVSATFADGGALHQVPAVGGNDCANAYPGFLRYRGPYFDAEQDDPTAFVQNVACMAQLGSESRAPNQALEAALDALSGPNAAPGFLRNDPAKGLSLIEVIVVADTDDCSATQDAASSGQAPTTSAACAVQSDALQSLERYFQGLRALRKGNEYLVLFDVVAGVPPELVDRGKPPVDLSALDPRAAFYRRILDDPAMQAVPDPDAPDHLRPACSRGSATAEPARRLISLAQRFGETGLPISICDDHWASALALSIPVIAKQLGTTCLPHALARSADGRVGCKLFWELPPPQSAPEGTPSRCSERPYLTAAGGPSRLGGQRCEVAQAAIASDAERAAADPNAGFYYDDFSDRARRSCLGPLRATIAFTEFAKPQLGIDVTLDCFGLQIASSSDAAAPEASACNVAGPPVPWAAQSVGRRCTPTVVPDGGFSGNDVRIETGASDCGTGVCMVYQLDGDPRSSCVPPAPGALDGYSRRCADPDQVAGHIYCSCRCDAADPSARTCACPHGFSCQPVLAQGGAALEGHYCVKDGTYGNP
jgi:hypothetical protein